MILDDIVAHKRNELAARPTQRFRRMLGQPGLSLVCELKLKSPTHPESFVKDPLAVLDDYKTAGVDAISVVTDRKFFGGSVNLVRQAQATGLPTLRKDFILNPTQVTEVSADALLLIARILQPAELRHLVALCLELGIEPVVEIHSEAELQAALATAAKVLAVNSRDLQAQQIDLRAGLELLAKIPDDRLKMLFSGIHTAEYVRQAKTAGAHGVLIGTSILTAHERLNKIKELQEACHE